MDTENKFAVVGLGALFPGADNVDQFWKNIVQKKVSIKEMPEEMFESEIFYRPELISAISKEEKSYTKIAAWVENTDYDTVRKYKIPPSMAQRMDENQHAALYCTDQALKSNTLDNVAADRVGIILGNGMVGTAYGDALARVQFQLVEHYLTRHPQFANLQTDKQQEIVEFVRANALKGSIPINEDSAPGVLPNIIAARVANVYDFHGPSFTVDAACASALTAIIKGVQGLRLGEFDAVICGGADMPLKQLGFIFFSAINALSPDGSYPFDERANGFVMGQGAGSVIIKRLEDAVTADDQIFAVITGFGEASDGKGKYIAAPNEKWQAHAIEKTFRMAGYPVDTVDMIEAHGTATAVGDVVEVNALKQAFSSLGAKRTNYCGLTSVKSNIGHLKSAAGIAGFIKTVLAIHHKVLPPTASFERINPNLKLENSPFYIIDEARDWPSDTNHPRRANVSAFGFGGANYHIALEEYRQEDYAKTQSPGVDFEQKSLVVNNSALISQNNVEQCAYFSGESTSLIAGAVDNFLAQSEKHQNISFSEMCYFHNLETKTDLPMRLAIVATSAEELKQKFDFFQQKADSVDEPILNARGIYFKEGPAYGAESTAIMFPGQASQYPNMLRMIYEGSETMRDWFHRADAYWFKKRAKTVSSLIYTETPEDNDFVENLRKTENAHPAIFLSSFAFYDLLRNHGLSADFMLGHSLGEITALAASNRLSFEDALTLVDQRGYAFKEAHLSDTGKMLSLMGNQEQAKALIEESGLDLSIANINSPQQIIVAGPSQAIDSFASFLDEQGINNKVLFVSHAFHSSLVEPAAHAFLDAAQKTKFVKSKINVVMNHKGTFYPNTANGIQKIPQTLFDQILQPVNFVRSIEKLYSKGVRLFVEVGPGSILSNLTKEILKDKEAVVLTSNFRSADDFSTLQKLYAGLFVNGAKLAPKPSRMPMQIEHDDGETATAVPPPVPEQDHFTIRSSQPKSDQYSGTQIVYSGVSVGLPGSYKNMFQDDNFEQLFEGRNFIERTTDGERQSMVDLNVSKLIKDENGPYFQTLNTLEQVIQLAGKVGNIDMLRDYQMKEDDLQKISSATAIAVAAGYEALKDAYIPLVREYSSTSSGATLPQKLALPERMQEETGVIFANGFPLVETVIQEVSRYLSWHLGSKPRKELVSFYEELITRVKDDESRKLLSDWFSLNYSRLSESSNGESTFQFNHHFMHQLSVQANNLLASLLNAKGPNFQINAACSSTSNAISIAEDFIRTGRVKRMIIVGADNPTSPLTFPYLGAGFLATGAATNEGDLYRAAIPFDVHRNGMIVSAGAVGLVLEAAESIAERGMAPVAELVGTHSFNTATHASQIDSEQFSIEMEKFIGRMESVTGLSRTEMAGEMIYFSHETYTPARGGCSQTEADALRTAFGADMKEIIVTNTKGMTGHCMGAAIEDAVAAQSLRLGKVPPVVNVKKKDPLLADLTLSNGESHNRSLALRMSAGFGSQGQFTLLKKGPAGEDRLIDKKRHDEWLKEASQQPDPQIEMKGRILAFQDDGARAKQTGESSSRQDAKKQRENAARAFINPDKRNETKEDILNLISEITTYPPEMLDAEMELDADLGLNKTKIEQIQSRLAEKYGVALSVTPELTIGQVTDAVLTANQSAPPIPAIETSVEQPEIVNQYSGIEEETLKVFSEVTQYPPDMLELDMEMEADLGIDTVKQATILSILGEKYMLARDENMQLSSYPTIRHIVEWIKDQADHAGAEEQGKQRLLAADNSPAPEEQKKAPDSSQDKDSVEQEVIKVFSEVTQYPDDMLELGMEMEADLGIDTVKQATILSILGEKYRMPRDENMQLSNYPTIGHIVDWVYDQSNGTNPNQGPELPEVEEMEQAEARVTPPHSDLSRSVLAYTNEELGEKDFDLKNKIVWIIGDDEEQIKALSQQVAGKKANVETFTFPTDAKEWQPAIDKFISKKSSHVIIDTTHIHNALNLAGLDIGAAHQHLRLCSDARFLFYKTLSEKGELPQRIICLVSGDVMNERSSTDLIKDPSFGALSGFYKSLRKEWPQTTVKILSVDPGESDQDPSFIGELVCDEIECSSLGVEIAYNHKKRFIAKIKEREITSKQPVRYSADDVFLITGGGAGIASQTALALADRYRAGFIIIDLLELPDNITELAALDEEGLRQLRQNIRVSLQEKQTKVTPALVNREYDKLTKAVEIYGNLKNLKRSAKNVEYIACDVRDADKLGRLLKAAEKQTGRVTAVLHAAGIDKSHMLAQKSVDEFRQVFSVKAEGAINLTHLLADHDLKLVTAFASISGRFGNAAQLDYSAANSFLNDWVRMMQGLHSTAHTISINWTGWKDVGIAWRNQLVREKSEEMGLNLIEVREGVDAFIAEIENQTLDFEIILHKGLNGFIEEGLAITSLHNMPLIDRITTRDGKIMRAYRVFSIKRDALIDQHRLGKTAILPAVAYSELAAEYYALQTGKTGHYVLKQLSFENAFKLFHDKPRELFIEGEPRENSEWHIFVKSNFVPANSQLTQTILHSQSKVSDQLSDLSMIRPETWTFDEKNQTILPPQESLLLMQNSGPEQRIILGPLYNDVVRNSEAKEPVSIYSDGVIYPTYFPVEQTTNNKYPLEESHVNPCFLDSIYQACAAFLLVQKKRVYLPWLVGELGIVDPPKGLGLYKTFAKVTRDEDEIVVFDVAMIDENNKVRYYAKDCEFRRINL